MVFRYVLVSSLLIGLGLSGFSPAVAGTIVGDKQPHPESRDVVHLPTPIPCDQPRADLTLAAGEGYAFADTTVGDGVVASYACRAWDESGPEHVYLLELTSEMVLDAWLGGNAIDHDLILLSACDSDSCLTQQNTEFSAVLPAGSYVLVVDGFGGASGAYTLDLATRESGLPTIVCEGPGTEDLGEFLGGEEEILAGNLFEQANLMSVYDCAATALRGGEQWYQVTLAADDQTYDDGTDIGTVRLDLTVTPSTGDLDLGLWLFDGCGPDAQCLAFVDAWANGTAEELQFLNDVDQPLVLYLAVDCTAPPASEGEGQFDLTTTGTVAVEKRSLSDLRGFFR